MTNPKPELLRQRPLRADEFYFSAPVVGGNHEQLTGYGRIGHGIMPCVDMTLVLPDGLPLSVLSIDVSMPSGAQVRPFVSVAFAPLQPGEAQQARDAMKAAGWTVAHADGADAAAEPSSDFHELDADRVADDDDDDEPPTAEPMAKPRAKAVGKPAKPTQKNRSGRRR